MLHQCSVPTNVILWHVHGGGTSYLLHLSVHLASSCFLFVLQLCDIHLQLYALLVELFQLVLHLKGSRRRKSGLKGDVKK